nr:MAG TPA: hypothetical protein [Caudoviricetes sp.]
MQKTEENVISPLTYIAVYAIIIVSRGGTKKEPRTERGRKTSQTRYWADESTGSDGFICPYFIRKGGLA